MPAVTVDDLSVLAKIPAPVVGGDHVPRARPVVQVETAAKGLEGEGFPVRRAFTGVSLADLDPFVHLDQMGEIDYGPGEPKGTPWHPHRGFETVTYMMDGILRHQDSTGGGGIIRDGGTQWMTAGKGILHIETPPDEVVAAGGLFHGLQLWVNLAAKDKWVDPRYQNIEADDVVLLSSDDGGALVRLIAGSIGDVRGPGSTYSPITMIHATVAPGARLVLPWPQEFNALVYVLSGNALVGAEQRPLETGQIAVHGYGDLLQIDAAATQDRSGHPLELLVLGGQPIREPVAFMGPFVMNTKAEIAQAFDDFNAGKLGQIPPDAGPDADLEVTTDAGLD